MWATTSAPPGSANARLGAKLAKLAETMRTEVERIQAQQCIGATGVANDFEQRDTLAPAVQRLIRLSVKTRTTLAQGIGISVLSLERAARGDEIDPVAEAKLREFLRRFSSNPRLVAGRR